MAAPPPMPRTRPLGVTILAILTILVGIGLLLLGLLVRHLVPPPLPRLGSRESLQKSMLGKILPM